MANLNGHEAGNGGHRQGDPKSADRRFRYSATNLRRSAQGGGRSGRDRAQGGRGSPRPDRFGEIAEMNEGRGPGPRALLDSDEKNEPPAAPATSPPWPRRCHSQHRWALRSSMRSARWKAFTIRSNPLEPSDRFRYRLPVHTTRCGCPETLILLQFSRSLGPWQRIPPSPPP
jgi:hypothetical protein